MTDADLDPLVRVLHACLQHGSLEGCEIEYWTGGGQPPPYYRSDQFRLHTVDGREVIELARPRYDIPAPSPEGGYPVERIMLPARPEHVRAVVQMVLQGGVFTEHFPEEVDPGVADILSTEVIVTVAGRAFARRYYRRVPAALDPLRVEVEALVRDLLAAGTRGLYHQGRFIAPLPAGPAA